jgi:hypothetical protein
MTGFRDIPPPDWPAIVRGLLLQRDRSGRRMSAEAVARIVACHRSRLQQLLTEGTEPRHSLGVALIALHERMIGPAPVVNHSARKLSAAPATTGTAP